MSSIVSRRPPAFGSVSQAKDLRWMSMRLGTSRTLSRRAKERRARDASTTATEATPREDLNRAGQAQRVRPAKIAQQAGAPRTGDRLSRTPPRLPRMWRRRLLLGGYGYRPIAAQCSGVFGVLPVSLIRPR